VIRLLKEGAKLTNLKIRESVLLFKTIQPEELIAAGGSADSPVCGGGSAIPKLRTIGIIAYITYGPATAYRSAATV